MAVKHVTTTSTAILYMILYFGAFICALSAAIIAYFLMRYLYHGVGVDGFTSIIVSVWFFGGITVLILGVIGIYIANILAEVKPRPYTHIRSIHRVGDGLPRRSSSTGEEIML